MEGAKSCHDDADGTETDSCSAKALASPGQQHDKHPAQTTAPACLSTGLPAVPPYLWYMVS